MGKGYKAYAGVAEETVWGTKVVSGMDFTEFTTEGVKKTVEEILSKGINSSREQKRRLQGKIRVAGNLNFEVNPDDVIGLVLKHTLWGVAAPVQQGATTGYLHAFTPGTSMPVGLTLQIGRDVAVFDYTGGKINSLKLKAAVNALLEADVAMVFKDESIGASQTPSYSTVQPFIFHQGVLTVGGNSVNVSDFQLEINNKLKVDRAALGSATILEPNEGKIEVKGSFKQFFENTTAYTAFVAGTSAALVLTFTGALISTGVFYKLTITLPQVYYNGDTPNVSGADVDLEQTVPFTAIYDTTATNSIKVELINTRSTQY